MMISMMVSDDDDREYLNKTTSSWILLKHIDPLLCIRHYASARQIIFFTL